MRTGIRPCRMGKLFQDNLHLPQIQLVPCFDCCTAGCRRKTRMTDFLCRERMHILKRRQDLPDNILGFRCRDIGRNLLQPEFIFAACLHIEAKRAEKLPILFYKLRFFVIEIQQLMNQQLLGRYAFRHR